MVVDAEDLIEAIATRLEQLGEMTREQLKKNLPYAHHRYENFTIGDLMAALIRGEFSCRRETGLEWLEANPR